MQPGLRTVGILAPPALQSQCRHESPSVGAICLCVATDPPQRQQCWIWRGGLVAEQQASPVHSDGTGDGTSHAREHSAAVMRSTWSLSLCPKNGGTNGVTPSPHPQGCEESMTRWGLISSTELVTVLALGHVCVLLPKCTVSEALLCRRMAFQTFKAVTTQVPSIRQLLLAKLVITVRTCNCFWVQHFPSFDLMIFLLFVFLRLNLDIQTVGLLCRTGCFWHASLFQLCNSTINWTESHLLKTWPHRNVSKLAKQTRVGKNVIKIIKNY